MNAQGQRRSRRRWVIAGLVGLVVILVVAYTGASFLVYDGISAKVACQFKGSPDSFAVDPKYGIDAAQYEMPIPEAVEFASRDPQLGETRLAGWWIPAEGATSVADAPAVVVIHGVQSCRREPSILLAAGMLHRNGYSVFLPDLRDHGDSPGDDGRFSGGTEEYLDVLGAWDWVRQQGVPADRIGIAGFSFGSANTMIAGGQERQVPAVWVDSGYPRTADALGNFLADHSPFPQPLAGWIVPMAAVWAKVIANDDILRFDPGKELAAYGGRDIAFVHGAQDKTLPAAWATELRDAAVAAGATSPDVWVVPGAGHTEAIYLQPKEYEQRLTDFFGSALAAP